MTNRDAFGIHILFHSNENQWLPYQPFRECSIRECSDNEISSQSNTFVVYYQLYILKKCTKELAEFTPS